MSEKSNDFKFKVAITGEIRDEVDETEVRGSHKQIVIVRCNP
jgi:hypothetical protein